MAQKSNNALGCLWLAFVGYVISMGIADWGGFPSLLAFYGGIGGVVTLVRSLKNDQSLGAAWSGVLVALAVLVLWAGCDGSFTGSSRATTGNWFVFFGNWCSPSLSADKFAVLKGNWFVLFGNWCSFRLTHLFMDDGLSASARDGAGRALFLTDSFTGVILGSIMMAFLWKRAFQNFDRLTAIREKGRYLLGVPIAAAIFAVTLLAWEIESPVIGVLQWFKAAGVDLGATVLILFGAVRLALMPFSVPPPQNDEKRRWLTPSDEFHPRAFLAGVLVFVGDAFALCILMRAATTASAVHWPYGSGDWPATRLGTGSVAGLLLATILPIVVAIALTGLGLWTWKVLMGWLDENILRWRDPPGRVDWFAYWHYLIAHSALLYLPLALALTFETVPSRASFLVLWSFFFIKATADVGSYVIPTAYRGLSR